MAFFRSYGSKMESAHDLNEKARDGGAEDASGSVGNTDADVNISDKDVDIKAEDTHQSEEEPFDAGRLQSDTSGGNATGKPGRRTAPGSWGSNFWRDCQPMWDSKDAEDDGIRGEEESDGNSLEELDGQGDGGRSRRGQVDVPADEMLSDDYYEQDGEEQSDSFHCRALSHHSNSGSRLSPKASSTSKNKSKSSKSANYDEYDDDEDYEEEDEEEEDDPDDADFEPDFSETEKGTKNKAKLSESDDFDDDDDDDDDDEDLDLSDEDDFIDRRRKVRRKAGRILKSKEMKSSVYSRRKRGKIFSDEEFSSGKVSEDDTDGDFDHKTRRSLKVHGKVGGRSTMFENVNSHNSELRTSGRSVKKISYAESEESEDNDEERANKSQKVWFYIQKLRSL